MLQINNRKSERGGRTSLSLLCSFGRFVREISIPARQFCKDGAEIYSYLLLKAHISDVATDFPL